MCLTANVTIIDQVIDERIALASDKTKVQRMFTAYDITREARARGATEYHGQMKGAVHARWYDLQNNGYTRSLINTPTGDAWLYHPAGDDITEYTKNLNQNALALGVPSPNTALPSPNTAPAVATPAAVTPSFSVSQPTPGTASAATTFKKQAVDSEGRLPIYADQIAALKVKPGGRVAVYAGSTHRLAIVAPAIPYNGKKIAEYTVNKDGRVRINSDILTTHCTTRGGMYKVTTYSGFVGIEAV